MERFVPIQGLHHWAYRCRDAEETRHFYEDLLGLPLTHFIRQDEYVGTSGERVDRFAHLFFEMADGSSLAFFDLGDGAAAEPSPNTPRWCNHMALQVRSLAHLERARQRLLDSGVDVVGPLDHDGWVKSIYFFDPNGARLELTTVTAGADKLKEYRASARSELDRWTREKRARTDKQELLD
jgi:catechol 2,3-dioxygenase-like lactoylglutathione lyase family enzyme